MRKKLFIVSDIHGHYSFLTEALSLAGFETDSEDHVFVSCGDLFDRGSENVPVYDFVRSLERKILIKGNHEDMLREILCNGKISARDVCNGTDITVSQFFGEDSIDTNGCFDTVKNAEKIRELVTFIDSMQDYFECGGYVFTHGWLPITFSGRYPTVSESWRDADASEWEEARFLEWQQLYDVGALLDGKIIVCGHRPSRLGHMFDTTRASDCSEIFYGKGMIAIDAGSVRSGRVNVLTLDVDIE